MKNKFIPLTKQGERALDFVSIQSAQGDDLVNIFHFAMNCGDEDMVRSYVDDLSRNKNLPLYMVNIILRCFPQTTIANFSFGDNIAKKNVNKDVQMSLVSDVHLSALAENPQLDLQVARIVCSLRYGMESLRVLKNNVSQEVVNIVLEEMEQRISQGQSFVMNGLSISELFCAAAQNPHMSQMFLLKMWNEIDAVPDVILKHNKTRIQQCLVENENFPAHKLSKLISLQHPVMNLTLKITSAMKEAMEVNNKR